MTVPFQAQSHYMYLTVFLMDTLIYWPVKKLNISHYIAEARLGLTLRGVKRIALLSPSSHVIFCHRAHPSVTNMSVECVVGRGGGGCWWTGGPGPEHISIEFH